MNKEQLKEAVGELNLVDTVFEADGVSYIDTAVSLTRVYDLIDQLEEPVKVVIPQFVADWIEYCKENSLDLYEAFGHSEMSGEVSDFIGDMDADEFARAWLDCPKIEVEKEKLYYVKLPNTNSKSEYLYLAQGNVSGYYWFNSRLERLEYDADVCKHKFTEKEIKDYDERFWPFVAEVAE